MAAVGEDREIASHPPPTQSTMEDIEHLLPTPRPTITSVISPSVLLRLHSSTVAPFSLLSSRLRPHHRLCITTAVAPSTLDKLSLLYCTRSTFICKMHGKM